MIEMNRWRTALAILAVGATGLFAVGCGDSNDDKINSAIDDAQSKLDEAQENGDIPSNDEIQKKLEEAQENGDIPSGEEIQKQLEEAQKNGVPSSDEVQKQIDDAQQQIQDAMDKAGQ